MAFEVRTSGPEFFSEENSAAFARLEESVRQYAAHSREPIFLIRRPLPFDSDHLVVLWPRGIALVEMYPFEGTIHGSLRGPWRIEQPDTVLTRPLLSRSRSQEGSTFENPYITLSDGVRKFIEITGQLDVIGRTMGRTGSALDTETQPSLIALFTAASANVEYDVPAESESLLRVMTVNYAVTRTIVHLPNLLRVADKGSALYSNEELEAIAGVLERSAAKGQSAIEPNPVEKSTPKKKSYQKRVPRILLLPVLILIAAIVYYNIRTFFSSQPPGRVDSTAPVHAVSRPPSKLVIELPAETELVVSPYQYQTRAEFDRALSRGEGVRFLPDTEQAVVLDSVSFAKGVYGYFRVSNVWRKGKLLQTFTPLDTVTIVKFLDPLP